MLQEGELYILILMLILIVTVVAGILNIIIYYKTTDEDEDDRFDGVVKRCIVFLLLLVVVILFVGKGIENKKEEFYNKVREETVDYIGEDGGGKAKLVEYELKEGYSKERYKETYMEVDIKDKE